MNSENEIMLRKYKANLKSSGGGYILFAFWGILKFLMAVTMKRNYMWDLMGMDPEGLLDETERKLVFIVSIAAVLIVMILVLVIHLYVGIGAIRYSRGRSEKKTFYRVAVVMFAITLLTLSTYAPFLSGNSLQFNDTTVAAIMVDIATAYILYDMIHSYNGIKRIVHPKNDNTGIPQKEPEKIPVNTPEKLPVNSPENTH